MKNVCLICKHEPIRPNYYSHWNSSGGICHNCYRPTIKTGVLTRTSDRITASRREYGADLLPPHTYDRQRKKMIINPEFADKYPNALNYYENPDQVRKEGMPKLAARMEKNSKQAKKLKQIKANPDFMGLEKEGLEKLL